MNPSPVRGGAEELLIELATRADPARMSLTIACLADGPFTDDLERAGARVVRLRAQRLRYVWMWGLTVSRLAALARDHDVVLSWQVKGHYYGTPAARIARKPVAWWDHGIRPARGERAFFLEGALPRSLHADLVVTSSQAAAARHRRAKAILPGIVLDAYEHPDPAKARALLGLADDEHAVGIVGRLQPWKGQHDFLRAAALLAPKFPRARFFVVGDAIGGFSAEYPAELKALTKELGISDRVQFLGHRTDVPLILPGLDVFVQASHGEPFGLVTVEAMAAGVPVVATNAGGTPEIITSPEMGTLVPPGDPSALARGVARFLEDPDNARAVSASGRFNALAHFSITRYVREVTELVEQLGER